MMAYSFGRSRPRKHDPRILIDNAPHVKIQRHNYSNIMTIPHYITKLFHIVPKQTESSQHQATALEFSYNRLEKSITITLDRGTKTTYGRKNSQYIIIPMDMAKQHGFMAWNHMAIVINEQNRTIKATLDTTKVISKTNKTICLEATDRVKELESALEKTKSHGYEIAYLAARLAGGISDPLNPDYWIIPILKQVSDPGFYTDKDVIEKRLEQLFGKKDWINSAFFVTWARESYGIDKGGLVQHLFNITRQPYDMEKDMETLADEQLQKYVVRIEPLTKAGTPVELERILNGQEPVFKPVFSLDYYVRLVKIDLEQSERRKKHRRALGFTAHAFLDPKKALSETWYDDGRGEKMTIWWYKIGDTIIGSIEDFACQRWASYDWLDDTVHIGVPNFDLPAALKHIEEFLPGIEKDAFP